MEVLISGQAATFASLKPPVLYRLDSDEAVPTKAPNLGGAFLGCNDVKRISVASIDQARKACEESWAKDRSLRCILSFLDSTEDRIDRLEFGECVEELILDFSTGSFVLDQLFSAPFPHGTDLSLLGELKATCIETWKIIDHVVTCQSVVKEVSESLQRNLKAYFVDVRERSSFFELLVEAGAPRAVVEAVRSKSNIDMVVMQLIARLRHIEGARPFIEAWTTGVRSSKKSFQSDRANDSQYDEEPDDAQPLTGVSSRKAFEQAMKQQTAIVAKLRARDLDGARRFVEDLVATQKLSSSPQHVGMSLSRLSHEAKELGVPELQIEWAQRAVEANPADPLTFAHLADALISSFRFNEAMAPIDTMESLGLVLAAANSRARILRITGQLAEARETYLAAAEKHADEPAVVHAWAGAAEVLRDMNYYEEALEEYTKLTHSFPLEGAIWCGRASVLMDLGRFDEAIATFRISETHGATLVPKVGMASAFKRRGEFAKALRLYNEVVSEFPNDPIALCGRADIHRDQGDLNSALIDYRTARERSPFNPIPVMGMVEVLKDLRQFDEANNVVDSAVHDFPLHAGLASLRAGLLMRQARYEEALQAYDSLVQHFPFHAMGRKNRADVLRRMERFDEALLAYESILAVSPRFFPAKLARLSLLIELQRFDEALSELPNGRPKSEPEWQLYFLNAVATEALHGAKAIPLFTNGLRNAPFAKQRRLFSAALGRHRLLNGKFSKSLEVIESQEGEVSNVIWLHALAASGRKAKAKSTLDHIVANETDSSIVELSKEIASRYNVIAFPSQRSREWIFAAERRQLLMEAA
jgi:tetratricopeptide (TPR) repeat protein